MNAGAVEQEHRPGARLKRLATVVAGILIGQCILYGPSLIGRKILLPLDILAMPQTYLPDTPQTPNGYPRDLAPQDLILQFEPERLFAARELQAGRFPFWTPYQYGGVPFSWPKYSPFFLFTCLTESPALIPWAQLLAALVAGTGAYAFCRRALGVSFWPATVAAWCYPMTGFFVLWQGFPTCAAVYWLPWLLLAVDRTVQGNRMAPLALALVTGLALVSGHVDVAGQALLVSGLYALWCLAEMFGARLLRPAVAKAMGMLVLGWGLGFLLAAPHVLPLVEYARTGVRMIQRAHGLQVRVPVGPAALPQLVLPNMYGSTERGAPLPYFWVGAYNLQESAAAGYTGLVATLMIAPWAWYSRRHRARNLFWLLLALFGLSWCLDIPGLVHVFRLPGLNMMSQNRLVFATSFAILALAATGLEALWQGHIRWRWPLGLQAVLVTGLLGWCLYRVEVLPEPLATKIESQVRAGQGVYWIQNAGDVQHAQAWFRAHYKEAAAWCAAGLAAWLCVRMFPTKRGLTFGVAGALLVGDLLCFSYGRNVQSDPALYFPEIPALRDVIKAASGRVLGYGALPADLAQAIGLKDVRGYDSIDPVRWLFLLRLAADEQSPDLDYARAQWLIPKVRTDVTNSLGLSPILDMMGVQYVILRGAPAPGRTPTFESPDYWVLENPTALPRVFVPAHVETVAGPEQELTRLGSAEFDARKVAYVEKAVALPAECRGTATIAAEVPGRVVVTARMDTPGLLVLADAWDKGWRAYVDGQRAPIRRTNFDLRGVVLSGGSHTVEFRYQPASVTLGICLAAAGSIFLIVWRIIARRAAGAEHA